MRKYLTWFIIFLIVTYCIFIIVTASTPPITRDALIHHLAIPKLYIEHGGFYEIPEIEFSYYPQLINFLYCLPLWFGNDIFPKYIHFSFALLTALIVYLFVLQRTNRIWASFAALYFLTIPVITKLSISTYIDLGLIFFSTACILAIIQWLKKPERLSWLVISAISCGLALSTKYTGLITLLIMSLMIPFYYTKLVSNSLSGQFKSLGFSALFVFIAITVFSPWLIKNYIWTGNPVYPLYDKHFTDIPRPTGLDKNTDEIIKGLGHFKARKILYDEAWWETWSIPIRVFFQGKDDTPQFFDGKLNPFLLLLPLLLLFHRKNNPLSFEYKLLGIFSIFFILLVFFQTDMRTRYIAPVIPPLVILSIIRLYSFTEIVKKNHPALKLSIFIISSSILLLNLHYFKNLIVKIQPLSYISGTLSRDEYLKQHLPDYAVIIYANQILPKNSVILAAYLRYRSYYFKRDVDFSTYILKKYILDATSGTDIYQRLKMKNFTHMIIRVDLFKQWLSLQSDSQKNHTQIFLNQHTKFLFEQNGYILLALKE